MSSIYKDTVRRLYDLEVERKNLIRQIEEQQAKTDYIAMMTDLDDLDDEETEDEEDV